VITILSGPTILRELKDLIATYYQDDREFIAADSTMQPKPVQRLKQDQKPSLSPSAETTITPSPKAPQVGGPSREHSPSRVIPVTPELSLVAELKSLGYVVAVAFNPTGDFIVSGGGDSVVLKFWDVKTRERIISLKRDINFVHSVAFGPRGDFLAIGCRDGTLRLWDAASRKELRKLSAHRGRVSGMSIDHSGTFLATTGPGSRDSEAEVKVWRLRNFEEIANISNTSTSCVFLCGSSLLAVGTNSGRVDLWDIESGVIEDNVQLLMNEPIVAIASSHDGISVAAVGRDGTIALYNTVSRAIAIIGKHKLSSRSSISGMDISPDGKILATASDGGDGLLCIWSIQKRMVVAESKVRANSLVFSPDGKLLAAGAWSATIYLYEI
jgi:WD40 repeat protein